MKIRNDFVSNSSSSSFIVMGEQYTGGTGGFLKMLRKGNMKYPEFMPYLIEYSNVVFRNYKPNHRSIINKFKSFLDTLEHKSDVFELDEKFDIWHGKDFILKYASEDVGFMEDVGAEVEQAVTENMKFEWMNGKIYVKSITYNGEKYEGDAAVSDFVDRIIDEDKFVSGTVYSPVFYKDKYVVYEFIKTLDDSEFEDFLDTVLTINSYQQTDGYDVSMSPEVCVFEKYNID